MQVGSYTLTEKIDSGGYGKVYRGYETSTLKPVAIKISTKCGHKVAKEAKILKSLKGGKGIPEVFTHGKWNHVHYMALELLGHNLYKEMLQNKQGFSLSCIIKIAKQSIETLKFIHSKGILHRDIKPEQILLSLSGESIFLVDYGLSSKYLNGKVHKSFKNQVSTIGSVYFASIHSHLGYKQSRRDDLESLFYTLFFLKKAHIPWEKSVLGLEGANKWQACFSSKLSHQQELFADWPIQFSNMFSYIRKLMYEENPNYEFLIKNLEEVKAKMALINEFDWEVGGFYKAATVDVHALKTSRKNRTKGIKCSKSFGAKEKKWAKELRKTHDLIENKMKDCEVDEDIGYLACQKTDKAELPEFVDKRILELVRSKKFREFVDCKTKCEIS
ncbi:hypothetical protein SteCoe_35051 [Stentor coeruleus]|uniref:Casein kinase I n=1 Tax=Stentor coeruleus TaxID=5963 RepID=A0A1R2ATC7_9CILI|nr:hypothetical protein SteCoe_35051 [Stentor coeruleus]